MMPCWSVWKLCHGRWLHHETRIIVNIVRIRRRKSICQYLIVKVLSVTTKADASGFPARRFDVHCVGVRFVLRLMNYRYHRVGVHGGTLWVKCLDIFKASSEGPIRRRWRIKIGGMLLIITTLVDQTGKISSEPWLGLSVDLWMLREILLLLLFHSFMFTELLNLIMVFILFKNNSKSISRNLSFKFFS